MRQVVAHLRVHLGVGDRVAAQLDVVLGGEATLDQLRVVGYLQVRPRLEVRHYVRRGAVARHHRRVVRRVEALNARHVGLRPELRRDALDSLSGGGAAHVTARDERDHARIDQAPSRGLEAVLRLDALRGGIIDAIRTQVLRHPSAEYAGDRRPDHRDESVRGVGWSMRMSRAFRAWLCLLSVSCLLMCAHPRHAGTTVSTKPLTTS